MRQTLQTALDGLARDLGLDALVLSPEGEVAIAIDEVEIGITLMPGIGQVHFLSIIGDMPETEGKEIAQVLLAANHMASMTSGAAIGFDAESDLITLNLCLPVAATTAASLATALETMANVTTGWRTNLPVIRELDAAAAPAAASGQGAGSGWLRM
jgi:Tir chaperone protein (CesT) family